MTEKKSLDQTEAEAAAAAWRLCRALEHDVNYHGDEDAWNAYRVARERAEALDPDGTHDLGPY